MKKCSFISILTLLFFLTGCSSDDSTIKENSSSSLSFGIFLQDFTLNAAESKQTSSNLPTCSDADPAYAELVLAKDGVPVVGTPGSPHQVALVHNDKNGAEEIFTKESADLELEPGSYTLEYFQVLDGDGNVIWAAPLSSNPTGFAKYVNASLPLNINLGAGVKKYIEVDVLCFDDRFVNQYGYSFFELQDTEAIEFCIFGNYCLENGRHAEAARYSVSIWKYSGNSDDPKGTNLYTGVENSIIITDFEDESETSSEPLCFALPDGSGTDEYYLELRLLDFDYETEEAIIRKGVFTDEDVKDLFAEGNSLEYYHFREGNCGMEDSPRLFEEGGNGVDPNLDTDGDGIVDIEDNCPYHYNPTQQGVEYYAESCTDPCAIKTDEEDHMAIALGGVEEFQEFENFSFAGYLDFIDKDFPMGSLETKLLEDNILQVDVYIDAGRYLEDHVIELKDDMSSESICKKIHPLQIVPGTTGRRESYSRFEVELPEDFSPPFYVKFKGNLFVNFD